MKYITLLPARMGRLELRNRIAFPAMVTNYCSVRGEVTDRLIAYHQERARGGAGLIITEATYISPDGKSFPHQLSIAEDGLLPGLRRLAEGVHAAGARIAVQLCHAGRQTSRAVSGLPLIAPSAMCFGDDVTHAMRQEDIERVIGEYARASVRTREAGFDAVELHASNGYLPQQFLSPLTNFRQDNYGGSLENRIRFSIETVRAVRAAVGQDFPIILRLGVVEPIAGGLTLEEGLTAARILAREDIDAIDVTAGMREGGMWVTPPLTLPHGTHIAKAAAVRQSINARKPVIGIGRITSIALADSFIKEGKADFVVMGRALLADPELPFKTLQEREEDIRPCIGCNEGCIGRLARGLDITCAVNPTVGNEYCKRQTTTSTPLKVFVVGAGPAGLVAACATRQRGHTVTVMEKEPVCGGKLRIAALPPFKQELFTYVTYLEKRARKLGVTICCGTEATPRTVVDLKPDVILLATGAEPHIPPIPGLTPDNVLLAEQALQQDNRTPDGTILIIGGGLAGCETALHLAQKGYSPLVVEMREALCIDTEPRSRAVLLNCSGIILATGYTPRTQLADALANKGIRFYSIGDCNNGTRIYDAVWQANSIAKML